ncbi:MAG: aldehyde reductase, partial [Pseudomonadota bacterium]
FQEMAKAIKAAYPERRIATRIAPHFMIKFLAVFDKEIRSILPSLGRVDKMDNTRAMATLGRGMWQAPKSAVSTAAYLIDNSHV